MAFDPISSAILIAVITAGASYIQAKKAQKKAKEMTEGVESNIESNSKEIPVVYGERRVGGVRVYIDTSRDKKHKYLYMVLAMAEGEVESITDIKIDDIPITDARFITSGNKQNLWYETYTGTDTQNVSTLIKDGVKYNTTEDVWDDPWNSQHDRDTQFPNVTYPWGDNHRLQGVAYLALKFKWDEKAYNGIPDVTAVVKGRKVYDPRTQTTGWSNNPALCIRDYLTNPRYGKGLPESAIDDVAFGQAATDCENFTVTPYTGSLDTHQLFTMDHVVDTSKKILENLNDMLLSCRAFLPYSKGVYSLKIDQPSASVLSIGADQIISGIAIAGNKKEDRFNQVKVNFFNKGLEYKEDQAIYPETNSTLYQAYLAEDDNEPLIEEVDIFSLNNFYSAREMARLILERSRQNSTISFNGTSELINLEVGEVVSITHPTPAWNNKLFQVQEVALNFDGTVNITCIEYDAALYTYDTPDEEQPFIGSRLPDPNQVDPATNLSVSAGSYIENDGKTIGYIDASWSAPEDELVDRYEIKFEYDSRVDVIEIASTEYRFKPTQDDVDYLVSVRAVNGLGIRSEWLTHASVTSAADTTAPSDITSPTISGGLQAIDLSWTNPSDDDFDLVRIKVANTNVEPASHSFEVRSNEFLHEVGAYNATRHYWVAPVDRTGNVGNYVYVGTETTGQPDYNDLTNTPTIPTIPEVAGTFYISLGDSNAPTDTEFNTAVGRDPLENDFVIVSYPDGTGTSTKGYNYNGDPLAWTEVTEYIDGSMIVTGSLSASDITTGTLNANDVTISNLTVSYSSQVTDKPTIPTATSQLTNDSGFIDDTNVVFSDDLGDYIRLDSVENLLLSFDKYADQETNIDWTGYDSPTSDIKVVKSSDAVTGGSYLEIGNNDGNDEAWLIHNKNIPFDPSQTYRVTVRAKQTAGAGAAYFGFAGVASDGTTLVNYQGTNTHSSQHYFAASNTDIPNAWTEYVGYVKGVSTSGTTSHKPDYNDPAVMHEDTRFVRPLILVNYSNQAGITLIDSFKIEAISANPNAIQGNEVNANVTNISGGVIQAGSQITVGTGDNIGALSGTDSIFRIWAGNATASSAPFRVSQAGVMYSTGAIIEGNITANSLDVENATVTGTFVAPIGWSNNVYSGVINRGNLNESVKDLIDERIAEVTGGISGDFGQDDGYFSHIAQGNPDPDDPIVLNITHETGKNLTVELSGSRSWNREFIGLPDTDMGVSITLERSPAGANTWTTLTTLTDSGSSITTSQTQITGTTYAYSVSIYHVLTDDQASGNYDYRARTTIAGSAYNVSIPLQLTVVEPATVGAGNADTLDNQDGTYYLDYNNFTNKPDLSLKADLAGDTFTGKVIIDNANGWDSNANGSNLLRLDGADGYPSISFFTNGTANWTVYKGGSDSWVGDGNIGFVHHSGAENSSRVKFKIDTSGNITALGTITASGYNASNWDTAYGWGNHADAGYLTSIGAIAGIQDGSETSAYGEIQYRITGNNDIQQQNRIYAYGSKDVSWDWKFKNLSDTTPVNRDLMTLTMVDSTTANLNVTGTITASGYNNSNWDTAYGWGNHASAGYLTSHQDISGKADLAGDTFTGFITLSAGSGLYQYTENGAYINWDTRDSSLGGSATAMVHKWANKADGSGYATYYENWWDGDSYHSIGVSNNKWRLSDELVVNGSVTAEGGSPTFQLRGGATGQPYIAWYQSDVEKAYIQFIDSGESLTYQSDGYHKFYAGATHVANISTTGVDAQSGGFLLNGTTVINSSNEARFANIGMTNIVTNTIPKFDGTKLDDSCLSDDGTTLTSTNSAFINGTIRGGFGASTTAGVTNWNDVSNARSGNGATLLLGTHTNGMGGGNYYYPFSFEYNGKDGSGNMTQMAIPYLGGSIYFRTRYGGSWNSWVKVLDSNSQIDANTLGGNSSSYFTNWANINGEHRGNITLSFRPTSSTTYAGFQFKNEGGSNAGYLLTRGDSDNDIYASNGITLVSDLDWLTLANRTGSSGVRIMTGTSATVRAEFLDSYINFKTHTNIGNIYQSNDGGWDGRLNVSGTRHGRMDVRCTNDGIITSVYSHTGNDRGTVGTLSNHKLGLMANGTPYWYIETDGKLRHKDVSTAGLTEGAIRAKGQIDTADVTNGTFRVYDGSTFRGGFGTARWGIGSSGAVDDMCVFSVGSHIELIVNSGSTRQYVSNSGIELSSGGFYTPNNTRLTDTAVQLYATNGAHVNWDVRPEGNFCVPHKYTYRGAGDVRYGQYKENWWDGDSYHAIAIVNGTFQFGGGIYASGNITAYSDIKVKENIKVIPNALDKVLKLNGYTYDRKDNGNNETGVIAQEVQKVLPQAVIETSEGLSVAYGNMVGVLIEAIKELKSEIEELKNGNN